MKEITTIDDFDRLTNSDTPIAIDFWASWCYPCKKLALILERVNDELDEIDIYKLNIEQFPDIAREQHVNGIPTVITYQYGKEIGRFSGVRNAETIRETLLRFAKNGQVTNVTF